MIEYLPRLMGPLRTILEENPQGLKEYDLLGELKRRNIPPFSLQDSHRSGSGEIEPGDSDLELFHNHFFLFHVLYKLRRQLRSQNGPELKIFCLDIRLMPSNPPHASMEEVQNEIEDHQLEEYDSLEEYYLDWNNYEEMDGEAVRELLHEAGRRISAWLNRDHHLAVLGLTDDASQDEINRRYRELCLRYHPDAGGNESADAQRFAEIQSAMEGLRR